MKTTRGGFTRGKAEYVPGESNDAVLSPDKAGGILVGDWWVAEVQNDVEDGTSIVVEANASLIAAAFNAATEVEDMGYNGLEAVKALPEILQALDFVIAQYELDPFLSQPAGGWESIPMLCLRLKTDFMAHLARECTDRRVIVVCHGHVIRALQLEFESLGHDDFIRLDSSDKPADKIRNCQILWYTRRDPDSGKVCGSKLVAVRSVCPLLTSTNTHEDFGWRRIQRQRYSNKDLLLEVKKYPRHIKG